VFALALANAVRKVATARAAQQFFPAVKCGYKTSRRAAILRDRSTCQRTEPTASPLSSSAKADDHVEVDAGRAMEMLL